MLKLSTAAGSQGGSSNVDPLSSFVQLLLNVDETPESIVDIKSKGVIDLRGGASHSPIDLPGIIIPNGGSVKFTENPPITNALYYLSLYPPPWSIDVKFTVTDLSKRIEIYLSTTGDVFQQIRHLYWENGYLYYEYKPRQAYADGRDSGQIALPLTLGFHEISIERQNTVNHPGPWEVYLDGIKRGNMAQGAWGTWTLLNSGLYPTNGAFSFSGGSNMKLHNMRITRGGVRYGSQNYVSGPGPYPI